MLGALNGFLHLETSIILFVNNHTFDICIHQVTDLTALGANHVSLLLYHETPPPSQKKCFSTHFEFLSYQDKNYITLLFVEMCEYQLASRQWNCSLVCSESEVPQSYLWGVIRTPSCVLRSVSRLFVLLQCLPPLRSFNKYSHFKCAKSRVSNFELSISQSMLQIYFIF